VAQEKQVLTMHFFTLMPSQAQVGVLLAHQGLCLLPLQMRAQALQYFMRRSVELGLLCMMRGV
jgi:hypothetical protein